MKGNHGVLPRSLLRQVVRDRLPTTHWLSGSRSPWTWRRARPCECLPWPGAGWCGKQS